MMKVLIIAYIVVMLTMFLMIPYKLLTSRQLRCSKCGGPVLASLRSKQINCPHCGEPVH
jgi:ribosomal protein S27AE